MTKVEIYSALQTLIDNSNLTDDVKTEYKARLDKDIELAQKKGNSPSTPKVNADVADLSDRILAILRDGEEPMTIPSIMAELADYKCHDDKTLTSQRVSAVLTHLGEGTKSKAGLGLVSRSVVKKVAYFSANPEE